MLNLIQYYTHLSVTTTPAPTTTAAATTPPVTTPAVTTPVYTTVAVTTVGMYEPNNLGHLHVSSPSKSIVVSYPIIHI